MSVHLQAVHHSSRVTQLPGSWQGAARPRGRHSACCPPAASNRDGGEEKDSKEKLVEGFSVENPDMWESEGFGIAYRVRLPNLTLPIPTANGAITCSATV